MKIEQVLEYQKLDKEMFKLEKELKENPNKKKANNLHESMKTAQEKLSSIHPVNTVLLRSISTSKK